MTRRFLCFLILFISSFLSYSQTPQNYTFQSPLNIPLTLAANFGELRPNHFHMGLDFKTNGVEGLSLFSVEEGFVSRIKISPYGYGKVIYIDHPNGITSVYAHCSTFKGKLDSLVKAAQIAEQNFEIEIFFTPAEIPVKKGELIALSGNTGSSTAPHLHFELRDTKTETALNPLLYGFKIADHKTPEIKFLKVYALTDQGYQIPGKSKITAVTKGKYGFYIGADLLQIPSDFCSEHGGIGFAFDVVDSFDGATNICGLYGSTLKCNSKTIFQQKIDAVAFDHSRYVNSHKDYSEYTSAKRKFHKSFKTAHNPLTIYPQSNLGIIKVKPGDSLKMNFQAYDVAGNKSELKFKVAVSKGEMNKTATIFPGWKYFMPDSTYSYQSDEIQFKTQLHTFYEPVLKKISLKAPFSFGDPAQPIQYPVSVKMKIPKLNVDTNSIYISVTSAGGKAQSLHTAINSNWIEAESDFLGIFQIKVDTIPPSLSPLNFALSDTLFRKSRMTWSVKEWQTELVDYDLFIDGKWALLEYESKGTYLFYDRPKGIAGKHKLEIVVKDQCGNIKKWTKEITF